MKTPWFKLNYNKEGELISSRTNLSKHFQEECLFKRISQISPCNKKGLIAKLNGLKNGQVYNVLNSTTDSVENKQFIVQARPRYF
jgi:hypothetical protein